MSREILKIQAMAFRRYGIPREQFLRLTPSEFNDLNRDWIQDKEFEEELADRRTGRIIAAIVNSNPFRKGGKILSEEDFMPQKVSKKESAIDSLEKRFEHLSMG